MATRCRYLLPAVGVAVAVGAVLRTIFRTDERPSWPPPDDAVTADGAISTVAGSAAERPLPSDVGLPYAWSTASTIEPHAGGTEFYPRIFADVAAAESSIHILMFGWKPGVPAGELVDLLVDRLQAGVEVRILIDSFGSRPHGLSKDMYTQLAEAGAEIVVNNSLPPRYEGRYPASGSAWSNTLPCRADHRKLYVIDGVVAWTGGAGVEDHFGDGRFHDVMVRVDGDVVRQAQAVFMTSFRSHGAELPTSLEPYFPEPGDSGAIPTAVVQVVPRGFVSATQATREMIDGARRRLEIMNPYLTDADIIDRIIAAARRGTQVRVVVSQTSNNGMATAALRHRYPDLFAAGVEVWEYPDGVVHAKVMVADDEVQFGTLNLDAWALYRNFEFALIARSADVADGFVDRVVEPAIARSVRGDVVTASRDRAVGWFANRIAYFL